MICSNQALSQTETNKIAESQTEMITCNQGQSGLSSQLNYEQARSIFTAQKVFAEAPIGLIKNANTKLA